ncbi:MAG: fimbrial protein FimV, partial [Rhodoferax sp.]|nr:fimbrial protein FimV [Rhodoferax sp.]
ALNALPPPTAPAAEPASPATNEMLSFDLDSLSLDLTDDRTDALNDLLDPSMDPLETKLALADEFRAIGDNDGARALIEEVIAEASGDLQVKAQQALDKL